MLKKMGLLVSASLFLLVACKSTTGSGVGQNNNGESPKQASGEAVQLKIEDAALVQDVTNPRGNTAEWSFSVDKTGRYEVWLSSITVDTMNLGFDTAVTITAGDSRISKMPIGDDIVIDDSVKAPYFRADSQMGSLFFAKPGEYMVQVISEKVNASDQNTEGRTLIKSLILKPIVY